jgi:hypothetical protein
MYCCLLCHDTAIPLDDAVAPARSGTCICLTCYTRRDQLEPPLSPALRRAIEAALA